MILFKVNIAVFYNFSKNYQKFIRKLNYFWSWFNESDLKWVDEGKT